MSSIGPYKTEIHACATNMAHALLRSTGHLQRLAQASAASTLIASEISQPASFTNLLAWHRQSTADHRKSFSSDDKQGRSHQAAQEQASASNQAASEKSQGTSTEKDSVTKDVRQDSLNILGLISKPLIQLTGRFAVWTVKNKVETSFDETEFLEGAKDAWVAVNSCMNHNDVEMLKDMVHPHLLDTFRAVFREQAAENKFFESQEVDVQHAQLATAMFIDPAAPPLAAEGTGAATPSSPAGMSAAQWSQWAASYARDTLGGSTLGLLVKDKQGTVSGELEDRRSQHWLFVRGPLPDKLPVRELDLPWQLFSLQ